MWEGVRDGKGHIYETSLRLRMERSMGVVTLSIPLLRVPVEKYVLFEISLLNVRHVWVEISVSSCYFLCIFPMSQ